MLEPVPSEFLRKKSGSLCLLVLSPSCLALNCPPHLFNIVDLTSAAFSTQEIYPTFTHKTEHFKAILQGTKVPYEEMLFFDDEDRNVNTVSLHAVGSVCPYIFLAKIGVSRAGRVQPNRSSVR